MDSSFDDNYLSKVVGAAGNVVRHIRYSKNTFLEKARTMDLNSLVDEYKKVIETIDRVKLRVSVELEEVKRELREYMIKRLLDSASELPLGDLIKHAEMIGVHRELLGRMPSELVLNSLSALDLDKLVLLYRDTWMFKNQALDELIKRLKIQPCKEIKRYINEIRTPPSYNREVASKLFENFYTRIDCPEVLESLFFDVLWVYRIYYGRDALNAFMNVVNEAIKDFDNILCRKHLELLSSLKRSHHYVLFYYDREEVLKILNEYANLVLKNFDRCTVQDVVYDMFESKEPLHTYADKRLYTEAVLRVLARDADLIKPATMARIIDILCRLSTECCCLVLDRLGLKRIETMSRRALQSILLAGAKEIDDVSLTVSFARILSFCEAFVSQDSRAVFADICHDIEQVWKIGLNCVSNPSNTFELIDCIYWLRMLKQDVVDRWCTQPLELPSIDLEKTSELIRRDLVGGVDPRELRDAIKKLEDIDKALFNSFRKIFDKQRRKLSKVL